jgi:hypothetical protein
MVDPETHDVRLNIILSFVMIMIYLPLLALLIYNFVVFVLLRWKQCCIQTVLIYCNAIPAVLLRITEFIIIIQQVYQNDSFGGYAWWYIGAASSFFNVAVELA